MARFVLLMHDTYPRPGQLLGIQRKHLVPPTSGVTMHWVALVNPEELKVASTTGDKDVSAAVDSDWLAWADLLWSALTVSDLDAALFGFDYPSLAAKCRRAVTMLGQEKVVLRQLRHAGASCDRADASRTLVEVKKRGQGASESSVRRYEKSGRLASSARLKSATCHVFCAAAEMTLREVMLFGRSGPAPPCRPL